MTAPRDCCTHTPCCYCTLNYHWPTPDLTSLMEAHEKHIRALAAMTWTPEPPRGFEVVIRMPLVLGVGSVIRFGDQALPVLYKSIASACDAARDAIRASDRTQGVRATVALRRKNDQPEGIIA